MHLPAGNFPQRLMFTLLISSLVTLANAQPLLRVGIAGLSHDHAHNIMRQYKNGEVLLAGIAEPDQQLVARYKKSYGLPDSLFYPSLDLMLQHTHPDAVLAYNAIADHLAVVQACAPQHISVMVEKPLATTLKDARAIAALATRYHIQVLTNYETTWYDSNQQLYEMAREKTAMGDIRKMIAHDGHQGPREIGCSEDFLSWLTDPVKNGGGALRDFGCYGANLMTWLMQGRAPIAVTATTRQFKPSVYPKVDDDAVVVLEYPQATGIIEASWNWTYNIKDWQVYGTTASLYAANDHTLIRRTGRSQDTVALHPAAFRSNLTYLAAVLRGTHDPAADLSSLDNNLVVVQILEAASLSARTGKRVELQAEKFTIR